MIKKYFYKETDEKGRLAYFDNVKFILIFLVVLGHLAECFYATSHSCKALFNFIYAFHMPLFIFISGYFSKKVLNSKNGFNFSRVLNMFLLCFLSLFIVRILDVIVLNEPFNYDFLSFSSASWYLYSLAIWNLSIIIISKFKSKYVLIFSIILSLYVGYIVSVKDLFIASRVITFYPFFLLGYYISKENLDKLINKKYFIPSLIIVILLFAFFYFFPEFSFLRRLFTGRNSYRSILKDFYLYGAILRLLYYLTVPVIMIAIINIVPKCKTFFTNYGARTLQIYILQMFFMEAINIPIIMEYFNKIDEQFLLITLFLVACIAVLIFGSRIFTKPFKYIMSLKWNISGGKYD